MARNGSGTYSVVNTFVSGQSITAAGHNQNWSDLATEMTNSLARDGQTTMTGQLKADPGTVSAPGYTFGGDLNCGFYRIGADNIGAACAGAKVLDISATGLGVTGTLVSSGAITATSTTITAGTTLTAGTIAFSGNGTKTAPSFAFTSDTDTGLYRAGADNPAMSAGDTKVQDWTTTGTTVTGTLTATGALSAASVTGAMVATQADQETGTSTTTVVSPGRQHFHPSANKFWIKNVGTGASQPAASYNITSITDTGTGVLTVTIATDFNDADYCITTGWVGASVYVVVASQAAGSFQLNSFLIATGAANDPTTYYAAGQGDQP